MTIRIPKVDALPFGKPIKVDRNKVKKYASSISISSSSSETDSMELDSVLLLPVAKKDRFSYTSTVKPRNLKSLSAI